MAKTGDELLAAVRTTITAPNNQILLTDDRILGFCNEEIELRVTPLLVNLRQEYFVKIETEETVSGQENYSIPYRAIGRVLRDLKISNQGRSERGNMAEIASEDEHLYTQIGNPQFFFLRGDEIIIRSVPQGVYNLEKWYLLRPNQLISTNQAAKIVGISGNVLTCAVVPTNIVVGSTIDLIQGRQGNSTLQMDNVVIGISGQQITLSDSLPITPPFVTVGDYVALAQQSPVIQLPDEAFPLTVALTASRCLEAIGDFEGKQAAESSIPEKRMLLQMIMAPRVEGENQKVIQRNGLLRGRGYWQRRGIVY